MNNIYRIPSRSDGAPVDYPRFVRPIPHEHLHRIYGTTIERSYRAKGKRFSDQPSLAEVVYVIAGVVVGLAALWVAF